MSSTSYNHLIFIIEQCLTNYDNEFSTTKDQIIFSNRFVLSLYDKYKTIIGVSEYGYQNNTASKTFKVSPISIATTTSSNNDLISLLSSNANNNSNNHENRPSTIIPITHIHIPTIKTPFHLPFH